VEAFIEPGKTNKIRSGDFERKLKNLNTKDLEYFIAKYR
jgi:hypothetical protein